MKTLLLPFALILCLVSIQEATAGGSVTFKGEVEPLLSKQPALKKLILATFEIPEIGSGVRLGRHFKELGGARIAPYDFEVTSKSTGEKFRLTIHCDTVFKLANGKPASDEEMTNATDVEETVTHFSVAPVEKEDEKDASETGEKEKAKG